MIKQYYTALPVDPSDDAVSVTWATLADASPGFAAEAHYGLVEYALADLWAQDAEATAALEAWTRYLAYESAVAALTDGRARVPLVHGHGDHPS